MVRQLGFNPNCRCFILGQRHGPLGHVVLAGRAGPPGSIALLGRLAEPGQLAMGRLLVPGCQAVLLRWAGSLGAPGRLAAMACYAAGLGCHA